MVKIKNKIVTKIPNRFASWMNKIAASSVFAALNRITQKAQAPKQKLAREKKIFILFFGFLNQIKIASNIFSTVAKIDGILAQSIFKTLS